MGTRSKLTFPTANLQQYPDLARFRDQLNDMASWVDRGPRVNINGGVNTVTTQVTNRKAALKAMVDVLTTYIT